MSGERTERPTDEPGRRARWMERAQRGDAEAYRLLLESISRDLRGFLRSRIRDPAETEDVLQEVLLTVHRARHTYDPARPFEPWVYAIARNAAVNWFRSSRTRRRLEDATAAEREAAGESLGDVALEDALGILPDNQREALEMVKIEGLSMAQAARRAGVSEGALRVRIHRAYRALRERLLGRSD
jgi:RNA polymerase sigma-70 factor, ECF subfamily